MKVVSPSYKIIDPCHPMQGAINLAKGEFESVSFDFGMGFTPGELEIYGRKEEAKTWDEMWRSVENAAAVVKQRGLEIPVVRAPYLMSNTKRVDMNSLICSLTEKCIDFCNKLGCGYIVVPPIFAGVLREDLWKTNFEYYLKLGRIAVENNIMILLENQVSDFNGHLVRGICSNPYEAAKWVDDLNGEIGSGVFGFCMDVGVCNICGQNMHDFACVLGSRIKAVVVRDNDGVRDSSHLAFTCTYRGGAQTDWLNLIRGLREICFDGVLIVDYSDTVAGFSPLLRQDLFTVAKKVGDYFKWQIELENVLRKYDRRVLFGAGNMCRNYMKCYGEKYPPLFTCDNNSKIWGTVFEGLEVKAPEALRGLPEDCAIFICNIYYDEIKEQLLGMGVNNPIEYFNDEYMPSFYFGRLDAEKRVVR